MQFTKMHGAGNDYVYIDGLTDPRLRSVNCAELAPEISDRHTGIGGDGVILIEPSSVADARMRIWNADGSEAEMCGNGLRCVAKFLYDRGILRRLRMQIETGAGVLDVEVHPVRGKVERVRIDMGGPVLTAAEIPTTLEGDPPVNCPLDVNGSIWPVTCVSMGNPHCVLFVESLTDDLVHSLGPQIEQHPAFPRRTNVEFVEVLGRDQFRMRVWERGAGETLACGTGACAALVAGVLTDRLAPEAIAQLPGGDLLIEWHERQNLSLTGPAVEVFSGDWPEPAQSGLRIAA